MAEELRLMLSGGVLIRVFLSWVGGVAGVFDAVHGRVGFGEEVTGAVFVDAQEQEWNRGGGGPDFGLARDF